MNTSSPNLQGLNQFKSESNQALQISFDHIELSPPLVLAAALLYMMAADGDVKDSESSQLQSVLGGNDELVACAVSYVESVPIETFLLEAAESLSGLDKLCVLTNVCDSFLADGTADEAELSLFSRMCEALGFNEISFAPYLKTIQIKNDKSVLGPYQLGSVQNQQGPISNHLAMSACMVYMMASDGSLGSEEIGRLQAAIGEFDGLQSATLKYALKVKSAQFLKEVAPQLNPEIKLLILTNVADVLLSDGVVEPTEKKLFLGMLTALGYTEKTFRTYYETLHIKNVKSFDLNDFDTSAAAKVFRSAKYQTSQAAFAASHAGEGENMGIIIHRTMDDNIASVSHNVGGAENVHGMTDNANNRQNIQKVKAGQREENIQYVDSSTVFTENVHYVNQASGSEDSLSRRELGLGITDDDTMASTARTNALESDFIGSSGITDFSEGSTSGKGGLTTMARGEISFRERAMQNGRKLTQVASSGTRTDAATVQARLQNLRTRNAQVEQKLTQLQSSTGPLGSFSDAADSLSPEPQALPASVPARSASGALSALKKWSQTLSQNVNVMTRPDPSQGGFA